MEAGHGDFLIHRPGPWMDATGLEPVLLRGRHDEASQMHSKTQPEAEIFIQREKAALSKSLELLSRKQPGTLRF